MRYRGILGVALIAGMLTGCASQKDLQALRAELIGTERARRQRMSEVDRRLEGLEMPGQNPGDMRRELAQTKAATEELRVEVQRLRGSVQEFQHRQQRGGSSTAADQDVFATKLAELETRLAAVEYRLDPTGSAPPAASTPRVAPPGTKQATRPATARQPAPATTARRTPPASPTLPGDDADRLYKKALREYQDGKADVAIVLFKQFLRQYKNHPLAGHAQYWIGESLYRKKQFEAAIVAFDEVVQKYQKDTKVPAAILKQGFAFAELKDTRNARFFLLKVRKDFPQSPEAREAAKKLKQLQR